tara:strand:+ start:102 stop:593 length:492 start_codon:yes stop_codon:yes gene_type:complete
MKKLLLFLLFSSLICFGQEDIERYKVYDTENIYTSILLDTSTGKTWQLQIGIGDNSSRLKTVLSDEPLASTIQEVTELYHRDVKWWEEEYSVDPKNSPEDIESWKPGTLEQYLKRPRVAKNGRFKLYPTGNTYNFIMVDVIDGRTWQVQWNIDYDKRLCYRID